MDISSLTKNERLATASNFVWSFAVWYDTPEGHDYWAHFAARLPNDLATAYNEEVEPAVGIAVLRTLGYDEQADKIEAFLAEVDAKDAGRVDHDA
jgi:hypothetical protein